MFLQEVLVLFSGEWYLEAKIWTFMCSLPLGGLLFTTALTGQS